jgi:blue copper oxidase
MYKIMLIIAFCGVLLSANAQTPIFIPDTLTGNTINLTLHRDSVQRFGGMKTKTLAFNQNSFLGPTLILNKGQQVSLNVQNNIGDTTTVHWHGLHVAPTNDGSPHSMIMDGENWNPEFTVLDKAATYWYHPHFHGKTAAQTIKGALGLLIVRDAEEAALNLPRKYGVDDFPIIVQCAQFDDQNQPMPLGMQDSTLLVNGTRANQGFSASLNIPAQVVRLRLLNASGERSFNFGLTNNRPFKIIASDGGLLRAPLTATRVRISPGERYEIVIDATGMNGQMLHLMSYASEIPVGTQGGPTMIMPPGNPPMDSPINGIDFNILQLNIIAQSQNPVTTIPAVLGTDMPLLEADVNTQRTITFSAQSLTSMDGPFYFNNLSFDMERIDYRIPLGNTEIWTIINQTMVAHPFHIHDVQFYVLDRDGNPVAPSERGRKDVVLIEPNETVRFITKFDTFADSMHPYMYHCHILMHEDDGMMGQFVVMPNTTVATNATNVATQKVMVFPNPTNDILYIKADFLTDKTNLRYEIINALGQTVGTGFYQNQTAIPTQNLAKGVYQVVLHTESEVFTTNFIKF